MSLWSKVETGIELTQLCIKGFQVISDVVKHRPKNGYELIEKIVGGVLSALGDERSVAEIHAEIVQLQSSLKSEDAAADAAGDAVLDKRFGPKS